MNYRLLLVCFFIFNMNLDCNEDCETKIRDLVNKWEHYDGEEFQPLSLKLSNSLLECDSIFFKIFQCPEQMTNFNIFIDIESFKLKKGVFVTRIRSLISKTLSRNNDPKRRLVAFGITDLAV